ncbi:histidine kinase [Nocardiopsis terrae]|uniref:Sensor-like histidine kinase SenX3 n=1 Tax=Nocardiopsis terrae TaxID=372655 RepID=A0ABR9HPJ3_9ACTN|nr:PAS domain S-box protein [Nocardiopsis terrae]MBE1460919.1 PAS domain S-box-containing protein [Nocardiopsis terrae]GHC97679.1 histidine kinase [Nocardiopsis terrae]
MSSERAPLSAEAVLASSADAVIGIDGELRVTVWNPAAERMFGWGADEVLGGELPIIPQELRPEYGAVLEQVRAGTPLTIFTRRLRKDGTAVDVRVSTGCVHDDQGRHAGWVLVLYPSEKEVQAQTSAMERARLVRRLTDVVADINADLSLKSVLDRIISSLTELTGADAGGFVLLDENRVELVSLTHLSEELYGVSAPLESSLFGELLRSGKSVLLANSATRSLEDLVWADLPGLHTIALCVSNVQGRPYGALYALYSQRKVGHVELELLELLAEHAGVAIGNAMAYEELKLQRAREQAVSDSSADGIAVLDYDGRVRKWNRSAAELTGYTSEQMVGQPPPFPIPAAHGEPVKHKNEGGRWLEILMARIPNTDEWVVDFRDITAQKALEEEREFFLASTGHELRTPVTVIQGYAALLSRKGERLGPEGRQEASEIILDRARSLAKLVERLRLGSDVASGEMTVDKVPFDLVELLGQAVAAFRPLAERQELTLDSGGTLWTVGDPLVTGMVIDQLLENALKFSPSGGAVRVGAQEGEDTVTIHVDDEGIGIDPGDEERIFERFFQSGERGDRRGYSGLGIGLYIVRQLVREQGGEVTAHRLANGTRMRVTLPRHRGEDAELGSVVSETPKSRGGTGIPSAKA